jgi:hypothetical protein
MHHLLFCQSLEWYLIRKKKYVGMKKNGEECMGFGEDDMEKEEEKLMEETKREAEMRIELVEKEIVDKLLIMLRINTK